MFKGGVKVICIDEPDWQTQLNKALHELWNNAEQLRPRLLESAENQAALGEQAYHDFCLSIKEVSRSI